MKILYFIYGLNIGGAETFIYNLLTVWDEKRYHIDFVLQSKNNTNKKLLKLCKEKGCNVMVIAPFHRNPFKSAIQLNRLLSKKEYGAIHIHANAFINIIPVVVAGLQRVPVIIHSHNTRNNSAGSIGRTLHLFNRMLFSHMKIIRIACGEEAGKWMFGKKDFLVVDNAIPVEDYAFSEQKRQTIRDKYGVEKEILIGHVGRFVEAKNHEFMIKCFYEIHRNLPDSKLILVGDGELKAQIENKCKILDLDEDVIFAGAVQNTNSYYSAFDLMLFPSLFEGMPFSLVEAQAAGVLVVASDCITKDVDVTGLISFLPLASGEQIWAKIILNVIGQINERSRDAEKMKGSAYDMNYVKQKLEEIYNTVRSSRDNEL